MYYVCTQAVYSHTRNILHSLPNGSKEIYRLLRNGWIMTDNYCKKCIIPLVKKANEAEQCVFCGPVSNVPALNQSKSLVLINSQLISEDKSQMITREKLQTSRTSKEETHSQVSLHRSFAEVPELYHEQNNRKLPQLTSSKIQRFNEVETYSQKVKSLERSPTGIDDMKAYTFTRLPPRIEVKINHEREDISEAICASDNVDPHVSTDIVSNSREDFWERGYQLKKEAKSMLFFERDKDILRYTSPGSTNVRENIKSSNGNTDKLINSNIQDQSINGLKEGSISTSLNTTYFPSAQRDNTNKETTFTSACMSDSQSNDISDTFSQEASKGWEKRINLKRLTAQFSHSAKKEAKSTKENYIKSMINSGPSCDEETYTCQIESSINEKKMNISERFNKQYFLSSKSQDSTKDKMIPSDKTDSSFDDLIVTFSADASRESKDKNILKRLSSQYSRSSTFEDKIKEEHVLISDDTFSIDNKVAEKEGHCDDNVIKEIYSFNETSKCGFFDRKDHYHVTSEDDIFFDMVGSSSVLDREKPHYGWNESISSTVEFDKKEELHRNKKQKDQLIDIQSFDVPENIDYGDSSFHILEDLKLLKDERGDVQDSKGSLYYQALSINGIDRTSDTAIEEEDSKEDRIVIADQPLSESNDAFEEALISHFNTGISFEKTQRAKQFEVELNFFSELDEKNCSGGVHDIELPDRLKMNVSNLSVGVGSQDFTFDVSTIRKNGSQSSGLVATNLMEEMRRKLKPEMRKKLGMGWTLSTDCCSNCNGPHMCAPGTEMDHCINKECFHCIDYYNCEEVVDDIEDDNVNYQEETDVSNNNPMENSKNEIFEEYEYKYEIENGDDYYLEEIKSHKVDDLAEVDTSMAYISKEFLIDDDINFLKETNSHSFAHNSLTKDSFQDRSSPILRTEEFKSTAIESGITYFDEENDSISDNLLSYKPLEDDNCNNYYGQLYKIGDSLVSDNADAIDTNDGVYRIESNNINNMLKNMDETKDKLRHPPRSNVSDDDSDGDMISVIDKLKEAAKTIKVLEDSNYDYSLQQGQMNFSNDFLSFEENMFTSSRPLSPAAPWM